MVMASTWFIFMLGWQVGPIKDAASTATPSRKLALLVGIDSYRDNSSPVPGINDLKLMKNLLGPQGYGFEEIKELAGSLATEASFRKALEHLATQARHQDVVVIYFSGHGSQVPDKDGDEREGADGKDETLMFWDSTTGITDDEFAALLANFVSEHVVVIIDACHAVGSLRGERVKTVNTGLEPLSDDTDANPFFFDKRHGQVRPRVFLAATTSESQLAFHNGQQSYFTAALVKAFNHGISGRFTYDHLAHLVQAELRRHGQIASFHGATGLSVFGTERPFQPALMLTQKVARGWIAKGPILAGWRKDSLVRIFPKHLPQTDLNSGFKATAMARIREAGLGKVLLEIESQKKPLEKGDWVLLAKGAGEALLGIKFGKGCSKQDQETLLAALSARTALMPLVKLVQSNPVLEITRDENGHLLLLNERGTPLVRFPRDREMTALTWALHLQSFLRHMHAFQPTQDGLSTALLPIKGSSPLEKWPGGIWVLPPHQPFRIEVRLQDTSPSDIVAVGFLMTRNGSIFSLPQFETRPVLKPGTSYRFKLPFRTGRASPIPETLVIFGTDPGSLSSWPEFSWTPVAPPMEGRGLLPDFLAAMLDEQRNAVDVEMPVRLAISYTQIITKQQD